MCGITGLISNNPAYCKNVFLEPVLSSMHHRGPDATQIENLTQWGCFGHNRLAIIDLDSRSHQPMWDKSHRYCLVFNGEIYNYLSLKKELMQLGHTFLTQSDSEVLVEAWCEWRTKAIQKYVGMFAFAIWDDLLKQLYLVRDRMGEKPLFYAPIKNDFKNGIIFASELKGLIQYPFVEKTLSLSAINHYLSFNYTATTDCIYKNIYKLPPASYLIYDANTCEYKIDQYWILENYFYNKKTMNFNDAQDRLNDLLKNAVQQQSISDVPLGVFLSGGIDSSSIVAKMRENNFNQIDAISVGFNERTYSELDNSKKLANDFSIMHHTQIISPNINETLPTIINSFDEPFADTSLIPTYFLTEYARQFVKVSLSGDGGDELFGGYDTYSADRYYQLFKYLPAIAKHLLVKMANHLPTSFNKISFDYKTKQFLNGCLLSAEKAHLSWREVFSLKQKKLLFTNELRFLLNEDTMKNNLAWFDHVKDCHYLDRAMYVDMKTWLVDDILVKVDRASMAHSLEVRAPFLDHRIVEFAASLPIEYKIKKRVLKYSQKKYLPNFVLKQSKKGFNSPISHWLANDLFEMAYDITTSQQLTQWFDKNTINQLWLEHRKRTCDNGHRLFNLVCLGFWLRECHV